LNHKTIKSKLTVSLYQPASRLQRGRHHKILKNAERLVAICDEAGDKYGIPAPIQSLVN